jgi:pteridine reductase
MTSDYRERLAGRTVLVTGGAHRVGGAISRRLAAQGARVLVHFHGSEREAEELAAALPHGGRALGADLADADGAARLLAAAAEAGETPDSLVHAAASFEHRTLAETTAADWDRIVAVNLRAFFLLARELARLRGERGGALVVISDAGALELWPGYLAHCVAKAALTPLVKGLAKALAPAFRVNGVIPGPVLPPPGTPEAERRAMAARTLLGRLGEPEDVASAVSFLLGAGYVTGAMLEVTGGSQLWRGSLPAAPAGEEA